MTSSPGRDTLGSPDRALRRLFLTLFLRGRSSRGVGSPGTELEFAL